MSLKVSVLKRLLALFRPDEPHAGSLRPLCRLRHATLHPGARLWTPGVAGGNFGGGAVAALEEVGVGGEIIVGFQSGAREPVCPQGVVARIEERIPLSESWSSEGLNAPFKYLLTGLRRCRIQPASATMRKVPLIRAEDMDPIEVELQPAPPELIELLAALSEIENAWAEHWREAFEQLPQAPLGQWATSFGWRLSQAERLLLFDEPHRIAELIFQNLDALHIGLAPERRREAVRVQALTRRTTALPERDIEVRHDGEGWSIFHPADVQGSNASEEALKTHFALGNVISVRAPEGARSVLRLSPGLPLEEDLKSRCVGETSFRLLVRHGRLFLGPSSLLSVRSYQEHLEFADSAQWFDVPNGLFKATVYALSGEQAPHYVVSLRATHTLDDISVPASAPTW